VGTWVFKPIFYVGLFIEAGILEGYKMNLFFPLKWKSIQESGFWLILISGLLAAAAVLLGGLVAHDILWSAIFLFSATFVGVYVSVLYVRLALAVFVINSIAIIFASQTIGYADNIKYFFCILIGMLLLLFVRILSWQWLKPKQLMRRCLFKCGHLYDVIFECYLQRDYPQKNLIYEKVIHERCCEVMSVLNDLRMIKENKNASIKAKIVRLERIYEVILSLGSMRYRVQDHSIFEIANTELGHISACLDSIFKHPDNLHMVEQLAENIYQLEQVNQSALQVIAHDPLVFLLFIHDLKVLQTELDQLRITYAV
jgi:hypothetical protein